MKKSTKIVIIAICLICSICSFFATFAYINNEKNLVKQEFQNISFDVFVPPQYSDKVSLRKADINYNDNQLFKSLINSKSCDYVTIDTCDCSREYQVIYTALCSENVRGFTERFAYPKKIFLKQGFLSGSVAFGNPRLDIEKKTLIFQPEHEKGLVIYVTLVLLLGLAGFSFLFLLFCLKR
ncbi:MAG: hypothetical protein OEV93_00420 [Candidatus Moranbacteria bacterium]|nr:hypothetical protein [Candidatus Moranbacteria bacterium]